MMERREYEIKKLPYLFKVFLSRSQLLTMLAFAFLVARAATQNLLQRGGRQTHGHLKIGNCHCHLVPRLVILQRSGKLENP